jgi:hypothetical protein
LEKTTMVKLVNEEMLRQHAPAIFAEEAAPRTSSRYSFLPTTELLGLLGETGWHPHSAQQVHARSPEGKKYGKHIVRLRHGDLGKDSLKVGDSIPEMVVFNSHDGLAGHKLLAGIFRMICSNGMIVSEHDFGAIHLRHIGFDRNDVFAAADRLANNVSKVSDTINEWSNITLTPDVERQFFTDASRIRWEDADENIVTNVSTRRRTEDAAKDLWTTFNVAQENLIRGGFRANRREARRIKSIQKDLDINSKLWDLTNTYSRELVAA